MSAILKYLFLLCLATGLVGFLLPCLSCRALAESQETTQKTWLDTLSFDTLKRRINEAWNAPGVDVYFPLYTWHNRFLYKPGYTKKYNEIPGGFGLGRSLLDEDGDEHAIFLVGFSDSNNKFEPYVGYFYIKNIALDQEEHWRIGAGLSLGFTARHEYNYIPLPLPVPVFSLCYQGVALQATYIPSGYNEGNVLFSWLRFSF